MCAALADHGDVCSERTPDHDSSAVPAEGNGGHFVFTEALDGYDAGRVYRGESWDGLTARGESVAACSRAQCGFLSFVSLLSYGQCWKLSTGVRMDVRV